MKEPQIDCRTINMTKTDQIAIIRTIEMLVKLLPKDTQDRLLWEAYQMIAKNISNTFVPEYGVSSALYGVRRAIEDAPSWMSHTLKESTNEA